jgi:hypothetical protein
VDTEFLEVRDCIVQVFRARAPVPCGSGYDICNLLGRQSTGVERASAVDYETDSPERTSVGLRREPAWWSARGLHDEFAPEQRLNGPYGLLCRNAEDLALALAAAVQRHHKPRQLTGATKAGHSNAE